MGPGSMTGSHSCSDGAVLGKRRLSRSTQPNHTQKAKSFLHLAVLQEVKRIRRVEKNVMWHHRIKVHEGLWYCDLVDRGGCVCVTSRSIEEPSLKTTKDLNPTTMRTESCQQPGNSLELDSSPELPDKIPNWLTP